MRKLFLSALIFLGFASEFFAQSLPSKPKAIDFDDSGMMIDGGVSPLNFPAGDVIFVSNINNYEYFNTLKVKGNGGSFGLGFLVSAYRRTYFNMKFNLLFNQFVGFGTDLGVGARFNLFGKERMKIMTGLDYSMNYIQLTQGTIPNPWGSIRIKNTEFIRDINVNLNTFTSCLKPKIMFFYPISNYVEIWTELSYYIQVGRIANVRYRQITQDENETSVTVKIPMREEEFYQNGQRIYRSPFSTEGLSYKIGLYVRIKSKYE